MSYVGKSDILTPAVNYGDTELSTELKAVFTHLVCQSKDGE